MTQPQEGKRAPTFTLPASDGSKVALRDFAGKKNVVLYFYPKDNTSGCTKEACQFRDCFQTYKKADAVILGVSPDPVSSHEKFSDKFDLPFLLLADEKKQVAEKYGVWQQKSMYGRKYMGIVRSTFVIDKKGKIAKIFSKVRVPGHDQEVLGVLKGLE